MREAFIRSIQFQYNEQVIHHQPRLISGTMSDKPEQKPKPLMTFVFDEVTVLTLKTQANPEAKIEPPKENAPILTLEADEMTEFVFKAVPASDPTG
jgi:hypothetical protein